MTPNLEALRDLLAKAPTPVLALLIAVIEAWIYELESTT